MKTLPIIVALSLLVSPAVAADKSKKPEPTPQITKEEKRELLEIIEICSQALGRIGKATMPYADACRSKSGSWMMLNDNKALVGLPVLQLGLAIQSYSMEQRISHVSGSSAAAAGASKRDEAYKHMATIREAIAR